VQQLVQEIKNQIARVGRPFLLRLREAKSASGQPFAMQEVVKALTELKERFDERINCVETGTIRSYYEIHESTRHIAETLGERGHLISVDLNPRSISISKDICRSYNNIEYVLSSSIDYLRRLTNQRFHFALLDSANDKNLIYSELGLILPHMEEDAIIIIDDAGITIDGSGKEPRVSAEKGHRVWELLTYHDIPFRVVPTTERHGTQLRIDLNREVLSRLKQVLGL
jgi:predicted O-methyltransferase YrrM